MLKARGTALILVLNFIPVRHVIPLLFHFGFGFLLGTRGGLLHTLATVTKTPMPTYLAYVGFLLLLHASFEYFIMRLGESHLVI